MSDDWLQLQYSTVTIINGYIVNDCHHHYYINRLELAFSGLQQLSSRYQGSHDLSKVQLLRLELLLENGQLQEACQVVEQCIAGR